MQNEFSFRTREQALKRFETDTFDLLVIGGGITGAAVARDAATRGLKVALVEQADFASGTSSRSSKLIHGGLRYLENLEFHLVFEALAERALLLKAVPHMVRPLPFYLPVYKGDQHGMSIFSMGLWMYDILALLRTPGFHQRIKRKALIAEIPFLKAEGLKGGFRYFDASMRDDVLVIETLRAAQKLGVAAANYVEAMKPVWENDKITGFEVIDRGRTGEASGKTVRIRALKTVVCAGPWTDHVGHTLSPQWKNWLTPSKGVHLVFDLKRIPIPGAMVMNHPTDGRISFVIPRRDYGAGVVIVGTTDSPSPSEPADASIDPTDIEYLLVLLQRYFPSLKITASDILSAYVGVRPLAGAAGSEGGSSALQKVSREHYIGHGPGGSIVVAGGKYTTHRRMAEEIVDFTLKEWPAPQTFGPSLTKEPVNPAAIGEPDPTIPVELYMRYGAEAVRLKDIRGSKPPSKPDPEGFPWLEAQLRFALREGMILHLEDFYFRRIPLFAARADHGLPWAEMLARVWAEERHETEEHAQDELKRLREQCTQCDSWRSRLK